MTADIIILTWNNAEYTIKCIATIKAFTKYPYKIIWVDNGSEEPQKELVKAAFNRNHLSFKPVFLDKNYGFPRGMNEGIKASGSPYVVLMNNDVEVTEGWLTKLTGCLYRHPVLGAVGAVTDTIANEQNWLYVAQKLGVKPSRFPERFINGLPDHCLMGRLYISYYCVAFRRRTIEKVGFLDEDFGIGLHEDTDYDNRLFHAGYKTGVATNCFVYHTHRASVREIPDFEKIITENLALAQKKAEDRGNA